MAVAAGAAVSRSDRNRVGYSASGFQGEHGGAASKQILAGFGFWIFLVSDIIMFSAFFASYAVLSGATAGGPTAQHLFKLEHAGVETVCLLLSSFSCGLARIAADVCSKRWLYAALAATFALGAVFLGLEISELSGMVASGAGPSRSAFLTSFFTLVGCHGLHVTAGMIWLLIMVAQVCTRGFRGEIQRRILCFTLFWHALDIIWVALLTVVYLLGVAS